LEKSHIEKNYIGNQSRGFKGLFWKKTFLDLKEKPLFQEAHERYGHLSQKTAFLAELNGCTHFFGFSQFKFISKYLRLL
jgi:hypothetical protein